MSPIYVIETIAPMNQDPVCSVIIPTYNGEDYVDTAIKSVLNQNHNNKEVIIVDDSSTDKTAKIVRRYESEAVNIYQNEQNRGIASTTNRAVEMANGSILAFIDQDDVWKSNKLTKHLRKHRESDADIVFSDMWIVDRNNVVIREISNSDPKPSGKPLIRQLCRDGNIISTMSCVSIKRSAWESVDGFDETLEISADIDLWFRLAKNHKFARLSDPLVYKRVHENNASKSYKQMYADNRYILNKIKENSLSTPEMIADMRWRLDRRRGKKAFLAGNDIESIRYTTSALTKKLDVNLLLLVILVFCNLFTGKANVGQKLYSIYYSYRYTS